MINHLLLFGMHSTEVEIPSLDVVVVVEDQCATRAWEHSECLRSVHWYSWVYRKIVLEQERLITYTSKPMVWITVEIFTYYRSGGNRIACLEVSSGWVNDGLVLNIGSDFSSNRAQINNGSFFFAHVHSRQKHVGCPSHKRNSDHSRRIPELLTVYGNQ